MILQCINLASENILNLLKYDYFLTTEQATIISTQVKQVLIKGILEDGGCISLTMFKKKTHATSIVISNVTFSPVSGGKQNPKIDMSPEI